MPTTRHHLTAFTTAGIALVGASVVAVAPLLAPPDALRMDGADVQLLADPAGDLSNDPVNALSELPAALATSADRAVTTVAMFGDSAIGVPLSLLDGDTDLLAAAGRGVVAAPKHVFDPVATAVIHLAPGSSTDYLAIYDGTWDAVAGPLGDGVFVTISDLDSDPSPQTTLAAAPDDPMAAVQTALLTTTDRAVTALSSQPADLADLATAAANGDIDQVADVLGSYVDAPLALADPAISAAQRALPGPLGGDDGLVAGGRAQAGAVRDIVKQVLAKEVLRDTAGPGDRDSDNDGAQSRTTQKAVKSGNLFAPARSVRAALRSINPFSAGQDLTDKTPGAPDTRDDTPDPAADSE